MTTHQTKIINPTTGRWVSKNGIIGKRLIRMKCVVRDQSRYQHVVFLWNWWSTRDALQRQKIADIWWDTRLNDPIENEYPFYIMDYESVLKKAYNILNQ